MNVSISWRYCTKSLASAQPQCACPFLVDHDSSPALNRLSQPLTVYCLSQSVLAAFRYPLPCLNNSRHRISCIYFGKSPGSQKVRKAIPPRSGAIVTKQYPSPLGLDQNRFGLWPKTFPSVAKRSPSLSYGEFWRHFNAVCASLQCCSGVNSTGKRRQH